LTKSYLADHLEDELGEIEELKNWHLFAGDGHYHKAAIFDSKTKADLSRKEPGKSATGHFFRLDLRTHHLGYLDLAQPEDGKKSEHDLKMLKRQDLQTLRGGARAGQKVFYLWDRAVIDYAFWLKAKSQKGIYFCTLEKSNSVTNPLSPPSAPVQGRLQGPPAKSKFLAVIHRIYVARLSSSS